MRFVGRVPNEDLADFYACGDLYTMLCRNRWGGLEQEGFGIVFLEAAAAGVPQVAGNSGGAAEAVVDLDRAMRMVMRDINHPSVIAWSLGNESGHGVNHDTLYRWVKSQDPTRPVQYEGGGADTAATAQAAGDPERFPDAGEPWQPLKLYYDVGFSKAKMLALHEAILAEVKKHGHDLIVMGVSRRPGDKLFFGDTAAAVLENAPASIVFVAS